MIRPPPRSTLFPSPTLSRSAVVGHPGQRGARRSHRDEQERQEGDGETLLAHGEANSSNARRRPARFKFASPKRSEEHTSELQSRLHLVCRLLLEKKKKNEIK